MACPEASLSTRVVAWELPLVTIPTVAARASASCGLKIADPNAKPLPVALGGAVGLGLLNIEATQTSTYPEIYIGFGPGIGPEIKAPLNPILNMAY